MKPEQVLTERLQLIPQTREDVREEVEQMEPQEAAELSPAWLALLDGSSPADPWVHGFVMKDVPGGCNVGKCGFKGPPGEEGVVEIAYFVAPEYRGKGYATEAAGALVAYAFADDRVRLVRAHTLMEADASPRVLTKAGFQRVGEVMDPDDGRVSRWERQRGNVH